MTQENPAVRGWITPTVRWLVSVCSFGGRSLLPKAVLAPNSTPESKAMAAERRAKWVDTFVFTCLLTECGILLLEATCQSTLLRWVAMILICWRIIDLIAADIKMCIFDAFDQATTRGQHPKEFVPTTPTRVILLGIFNYVELLIGFACIYCFGNKLIAQTSANISWASGATGVIEQALHLSVVTQLTIGFGDLAPTGWLRPIVWLQGGSGLALIALFITRYLSMLPAVP